MSQNKAKKGKHVLSEEEKREQIRLGLLKKKEFEKKALEIVSQLIEENVDEELFLAAGNLINQRYYDDIVEERSLSQLCGYPLCSSTLVKGKTSKYRISLRDKKVYNVEERRKFCSDHCFKSSNFYRHQVEDSPLWLREEQKKTFELFDSDKSSSFAGKGCVEDISSGLEKLREEFLVEGQEDSKPQPIENDDATASSSTEDIRAEGSSSDENCESLLTKTELEPQCKLQHCVDGPAGQQASKSAQGASNESAVKDTAVKDTVVKDSTVKDTAVKDTAVKHSAVKDTAVKDTVVKDTVVTAVIKALTTWFTIDSYRVVMGSEHLRNVLTEKGADEATQVKVVGDPLLKEEMQARYLALCRRLDDKNEDEENSTGEAKTDDTAEADYKSLQEEVDLQHLKISSYYQGREVYEQEVRSKKVKENEVETVEPRLPLIDKHAQSTLRRKILIEKFSRTLPELLTLLRCSFSSIRGALTELVHSFHLTSETVTFKPGEWTLISLLVIYMLTLRNGDLAKAWSSDESRKYIGMMLLSFNLTEEFLSVTVNNLTSDVSNLLLKMKLN